MNTDRPHDIVSQIPPDAPPRKWLPISDAEAATLATASEDQRAAWFASLSQKEKERRYAMVEMWPASSEDAYRILRFFHYEHLPPALRVRAQLFADVARAMAEAPTVHPEEVAAGLRKLLEAKDCFVRAALA